MKRIAIVAAFCFATICAAQTDNTLYVKQFPGSDVGTKVTNALKTCANASITCILVIDPSMASFSSGTMPALGNNILLVDYRKGFSFSGSLGAGSTAFGGPKCDPVFYGADPTGTANSLPAIQQCQNILAALNGGTVYLHAGKYKVSAAIVASTPGVWFEGDGPYSSTTIRGTQIISTAVSDDIFRVPDGTSYTGMRNMYLSGNASGTSGYGVNLSAVTATTAHLEFHNAVVGGAPSHGWMLQAGQGSGGFLFDVLLDHISSLYNKGDGIHAIGRWSEVTMIEPYVDRNPTGTSFYFDGGSAGDGGEITLVKPISGVSTTGFTFHNTGSFDVIDPHIESSSVAQIAISSARRGKIGGGACSIKQSGTALGITFTSSLYPSDSIEIDCPQWTNSTSNTQISYLGGSVINVQLGSTANRPFTRADITGTESPNNGFLFKPVMSQNSGAPTSCFAGELYYDSTGGAGICLTANSPTSFLTSVTGTTCIGEFDWTLSNTAGPQTITGCPFKPSSVIFSSVVQGTTQTSTGTDNGTAANAIYFNANAGTSTMYRGKSIALLSSSVGVNATAKITSLNSNGFTITWVYAGTPAGTASTIFTAFR